MQREEHVVAIAWPIDHAFSMSENPTDHMIDSPSDMKNSTSTSLAGEALGEEHVVGIVEPNFRALRTSENPTEVMIQVPSDLKISISTYMTSETMGNTNRISEDEEQLNSLLEKIKNWNWDPFMTGEHGADKAAEYVEAVKEIQRLKESLGCLSINGCQEKDELLQRVHNILQMALARLEQEFSLILIHNRQSLEPESFYGSSPFGDVPFVDSITSVEDESSEDTHVRPQRDNTRGLEDCIIDLVRPNVIPVLKFIAEVMLASGYDIECCQAYISIRKDALQKCLLLFEVEKISIKDVLLMDWSSLNSKIKKWAQVVKILPRVYLASEKNLADKVFGISGSVSKTCFVEASKSFILQLLSFSEAVAIRNYSPEKIFPILYMCHWLMDLLPTIDVFFSGDAGSSVSTEAHEVLIGLGESVTRTLDQFRNAVNRNELSTPFAGGGVHNLTRYVMKYLKALGNYSDTLNFLVEVTRDDHSPSPSYMNTTTDDDGNSNCSHIVSPAVCRIQSLVSVLEGNLRSKSQLYTDVSLQHFFLMNNICFMAQKVKDSELRHLLGENWIRKHIAIFQQHAVNYERASWNLAISFLREEGIRNPKSSSYISKAILMERFLGFNHVFEEIYRTQTAWLIDNNRLREDLRISISLKVLQGYRAFFGRYSRHLAWRRNSDRYLKYSPEDLQELLLDLFEGSSRSLHKSHKR